MTASTSNILLDMPFGGKMQKVLVHIDRNGYIYVIERTHGDGAVGRSLRTGELDPGDRSADRTARSSILTKMTKLGETVRNICPDGLGSQGLEPISFSPRTGLLYIPHENMCMDWENVQVELHRGHAVCRRRRAHETRPGRQSRRGDGMGSGTPQASLAGSKKTFRSGRARSSPPADLVFYGTMDGWFKAANARTGALLWRFKVDSGIISQPISYRGPDGHQYIAVLSRSRRLVRRRGLRARRSARRLARRSAWWRRCPICPKYTTAGGTLYVFALPQH